MSHPWSLTRNLLRLFACFVICVQATNWAAAELITKPADAGNYYYLAFVTSTTYMATSDDINYYNEEVSKLANAIPELAALDIGARVDNESGWFAIGSTATVDARDNIAQTAGQVPIGVSAPVYDLHGNRIANSLDDLWDGGDLLSSINVTEQDTTYDPFANVWTGTGTDGTGSSVMGNAGGGSTTYARSNATNNWWINASTLANTNTLPLYAISGVIPEPGTLSLALSMALVGAGGAWYRRRKRRRNKA